MKKLLLTVVAVFSSICSTVYAGNISEAEYDITSNILSVSGSTEINEVSDLQAVTMRVFKPGFTQENISELSDEEKKNAVAFVKQQTINTNGSFSFI